MPRLNWNLVNDHGSLFVLGDSTYIDNTFAQVSEMATSNGYTIQTKPFTPDLDEFEGWSLMELKLIKRKNTEN